MATQRWYSRIHSPWLWGASIALIVTVAFRVEVWAQATFPTFSTDMVPASGGNLEITPIAHASVQIEHGGTVIHVDPARPRLLRECQTRGPDPRHRHPGRPPRPPSDYGDPQGGRAGRRSPERQGHRFQQHGARQRGDDDSAGCPASRAVPSYDLKPGGTFHPKGRGNGYVVTLGGARLYFSGGGLECVPEVQALTDIDVAFLAMNLPNERMTPLAAAECVKIFKPKIVYPYHYRDANLEVFRDALEGLPIDVRLADWYPAQ